jgi:hypothetical protein
MIIDNFKKYFDGHRLYTLHKKVKKIADHLLSFLKRECASPIGAPFSLSSLELQLFNYFLQILTELVEKYGPSKFIEKCTYLAHFEETLYNLILTRSNQCFSLKKTEDKLLKLLRDLYKKLRPIFDLKLLPLLNIDDVFEDKKNEVLVHRNE